MRCEDGVGLAELIKGGEWEYFVVNKVGALWLYLEEAQYDE